MIVTNVNAINNAFRGLAKGGVLNSKTANPRLFEVEYNCKVISGVIFPNRVKFNTEAEATMFLLKWS